MNILAFQELAPALFFSITNHDAMMLGK